MQCVGSLVYGAIIGKLLWLLFLWMTPHMMSINWVMLIVLLILGGVGLVGGSVYVTKIVLSRPALFLMKGNTAAKIFYSIPLLLNGYFAGKMPWVLLPDTDCDGLQYTIAVCLSIIYMVSFAAIIYTAFDEPKKRISNP